MRIALGLIAAVAVVVVAVLLYAAASLDRLVKQGIETYGSRIVGAPVRVGSVEISLSSGRGTLRELSISNPDGFSSGEALRLGEITLDIQLSSLTQEPLVIQEVKILAPEVNAEVSASGSTNIDELRRSVSTYGGTGSDGKPATDSSSATEDGTPPPRLRIDELEFAGGRLAADTTAVGGDVRVLELAPLRLSGLGGKNGQPIDVIAKSILDSYTRSIASVVGKSMAASRAEKLIDEKVGGELGEAAKGLLDRVLD